MEKITRLALSLKFNPGDIDSIMEIIEATGNTQVATEILLGVYEAPEVAIIAPNTKYETNRKLVNYDKFKDEVKYTYNSVKELSAWFLKGQEDLSLENSVSKKTWTDDVAKELAISTDEVRRLYTKKVYDREIDPRDNTSITSLKNWQEDNSERVDSKR
jgi:thymidylate synthase